jgi:hypothetical protein
MFSVIIAALFSGCLSSPRSISSDYEILPVKPDGFAVSKRVLLVADNQLNHLYGEPMWLRNELFDHIVSVAIRPVQQDLFGPDILRWTLEYYGHRIPVVHLGDGTNMACVGEFKSFTEIMDTARGSWVMAPGNHDAYMLGNLHTEKEDWWEKACLRAEGPMTKDLFVKEYLAHLKNQHPEFGTYLDSHPKKGEWRSSGDNKTFLRAVAWKIDEEKPYRSFVLQELDLSRSDSDLAVSAILLDSTQFKNAPTLVPGPLSYNAGINGSALSDQMDLAKKWLQNDPTGKKMTILMVHHPYANLIKSTKSMIDEFRTQYRIPLYVSGHTHHGEYFVRGGDNGWIEMNVGSIVDWPIEFRTFEIHEINDDPNSLIFRAPLFRIPDMWDHAVPPRKVECNAQEWEIAETQAKDFYLAHTYRFSPAPDKTQKDLLVALLHTYRNLINKVESADDNTVWPTGSSSDRDVLGLINNALENKNVNEMTTLLIALGEFEARRKPKDEMIQRDYRICQSVWASKYDKVKGRKPVITDPYIQFPKGDKNE